MGLLFSVGASAQTGKVLQGLLRDSLSRVVSGASVKLIQGKDTLSTSSSVGGVFTFNEVKGNTFTVKISSVGFEPFEKEFTFPQSETKFMVPAIILNGNPKMLEEVVVSGVLTVQVKGDTVEYTTKDLKLREGSVAEDALKKLQGVEVDNQGNVTAQGEAVTRVRINGKDYFGGDVKTATQNLPANIIEKMQIVDDYGDMANITGNKTGESTKVLNIQIDPKYNKGFMTTLRVGGGTNERYQATGMVMAMNNKTQISILGNLNNMNADLFDFNAMGGGARGRQGAAGGRGPGSGMFGGTPDGITKTGSLGVNFRHDFSDKLKLYGSYSYGHNNNNTIAKTHTENVGVDSKGNMITDAESNSTNIRASHRFEANLEWNISPKDYLKITPQFGFNNTRADAWSHSEVLLNDRLNNTQDQTSWSKGNSPRYNISGLYNRKLNDKGRNLFVNFNYDNGATNSDVDQILDQYVADPANRDEPLKNFYTRINREIENKSWNAGSTVSYTEPLTLKSKLEFSYDFNTNDYDNRNTQIGRDSLGNILTEKGTNYDYNYDYAFTTHRVGASYIFSGEKLSYSLGAAVQPSLLRGNAYGQNEAAVIDRKNFNFVPIARLEYKFSRQSNITVNYSGRSNEPSVTQILPFEVSTSQVMTTIGNENLNPEFRHSLNARYRAGDFQKGKTFFAMLRADLTQDKIVSMVRRIPSERNGIVQEVGYENESAPVYNIGSFYFMGRSLKNKTYTINYGGGVNYSRNISYLNVNATGGTFDKLITNNTVISQMLSFRYNPSEKFEIAPGVRYAYNISSTTLARLNAANTSKLTPNLIGSVNITPTLVFGADLSKEFNYGYQNNANPFVINSYVEQKFLKGQRGAFRLQAYDLLNQQVNINRTVGEALVDSQTNRLGRYFMLSFTFKLQKFSGIAPVEDNPFPAGMRPMRR